VQIYTRSPPPTPALPGGRGVVSACSVDNASRVLEGHRLFSLPVDSPAFCASWCEHTTYSENGVDKKYNWAGVENGDECICGTGWKNGIGPPSAPTYDCATPCPENPTDSNGCGGSWRIQVFRYEWNWGEPLEDQGAVGGGGCGSVGFGTIRIRVFEIEIIYYLMFLLCHFMYWVVNKALPILDYASTGNRRGANVCPSSTGQPPGVHDYHPNFADESTTGSPWAPQSTRSAPLPAKNVTWHRELPARR